MDYNTSVFINCPFDRDYAPLLEAMVFVVIRSGLTPKIASESLEAGKNHLDKILELISECRFSIHDLSRAVSKAEGEHYRMNMPFELGLDMGWRRAPDPATNDKKFLIFEKEQYELKRSLSDLNGVDVAFHKDDYQRIIRNLRDFLCVEADCRLPGPTKLEDEYAFFQGWMTEKKIYEGHTEKEALELPTKERVNEMKGWMQLGKPEKFIPIP